MASEFYHKTAAMFEEFKKRELQYLNLDKMNSSVNWKNDCNVSTQDYLQKINKRERETDQTYRELMKHMEDLDKKTDQMSLKLEKLHALRNIAISSNITAWPSVDVTFDKPLQSYYNRSVMHTATIPSNSTFNALHSIPTDYTFPKFNSLDESTQTDDFICAHCHFPLSSYSYHKSDTSKTLTSTNESDALIHKMYKTFQNPRESGMPSISNMPIDTIKESLAEVDYDTNKNIENYSFPPDLNLNVGELIPSQIDFIPKDKISADVPTLKSGNEAEVHSFTEVHLSETDNNRINIKEKECVEENTLGHTGTVEHAPISKSDDESMNHEFDFLESDKRSSIKSDDTQLLVPNFSNQINLGTEKLNVEDSHDTTLQENTASFMKMNSESDVNESEYKKNMKQDSEKSFPFDANNIERIKISEDFKLDSSVSGGHPTPSFHSENASLASESDTLSEKETPLTASAAYQALINNASTAKTAQKRQPISDSDSEDEIENALATAVRKSSNVTFETPGPILKTERKESVPEVRSDTKASISATKPQTKLSKSTRKVLGLDTSSGSEVELTVKTNLNQNAEDSDEFDFYD